MRGGFGPKRGYSKDERRIWSQERVQQRREEDLVPREGTGRMRGGFGPKRGYSEEERISKGGGGGRNTVFRSGELHPAVKRQNLVGIRRNYNDYNSCVQFISFIFYENLDVLKFVSFKIY